MYGHLSGILKAIMVRAVVRFFLAGCLAVEFACSASSGGGVPAETHVGTTPDADASGMVRYPNVNTVKEMADLITAVRAYEANLSVQENYQRIADRALRMME